MSVIQCQKITKPVLKKYLNVPAMKLYSHQSCEDEPDCCGKLPPPKPPIQPVIEKECVPCIFDVWKPKIPALGCQPIIPKKVRPCFKKKHCYAGMKPPPCHADIKEEAKQRWEKNSPSALLKPQEKSEPTKPTTKLPGTTTTVCLPYPDWNHNGSMD